MCKKGLTGLALTSRSLGSGCVSCDTSGTKVLSLTGINYEQSSIKFPKIGIIKSYILEKYFMSKSTSKWKYYLASIITPQLVMSILFPQSVYTGNTRFMLYRLRLLRAQCL